MLSSLQTLNVSDCDIKQIRFEDTTNKTKLFRQLSALLISNNNLSDWRDIAELNKLEKLDNLLIKNNPVFDNEKYDTNFYLILSRIENLKILNKENVNQFIYLFLIRHIFSDSLNFYSFYRLLQL